MNEMISREVVAHIQLLFLQKAMNIQTECMDYYDTWIFIVICGALLATWL